MKKLYASLALALCVSVSASAIDSQYKGAAKQVNEKASFTTEKVASQQMRKPGAEGLAEGVNMYTFKYYTAYTTPDGTTVEGWESQSVVVELNGTEAVISGLFDLASVNATYDSATKMITIPEQDVFYTYNGEKIRFYPWKYVPAPTEEKPNAVARQASPLLLQYTPAGTKVTMNSGEEFIMGVDGFSPAEDSAFWFSCPSIVGQGSGFVFADMPFFGSISQEWPDCQEFTFNASEWKEVGTAKFTDGWIQPMWEGEIPTVDVKCMINNENPNLWLLVDPYKAIFETADSGYIQLDVTNPDCVLVTPFVYSGFNLSYYMGAGAPGALCICMTNSEAMTILVDGFTMEDVIEDAEFWGDELANYKDNVVTIPQCRIQTPSELGVAQIWSAAWGGAFNDPDDPIDDDLMVATIVLPEVASVEGLTVENSGVKRFFNLQGMEVKAPAAGELVIVKDGSKTTKTIVR